MVRPVAKTSDHPACCPDPKNCTLSYIEHLQGFGGNTTPKRPRKRPIKGLSD